MERVGVVGCGLMGAGIAEVMARAGLEVVVVEADDEAAAAGRQRMETSLGRAHARGKVDDIDAVLQRVTLTTDFDALADRQLVVEAVVEDERAKIEVFRRLDRTVTAGDAVLASNTSSIPVTRLGV